MSLAKVLAYAQSQGSTLILSSLLPDGFTSEPAEDRMTRMARVLAFAQGQDMDMLSLAGESQVKGFERVVRGKEEFVRPHASMEHGWAHPDAVGGHKVTGVYTHPKTGNALYDLGNGLHAEGVPGKSGQFKAGAVMKSNTGLQREALAQKGWKFARPPKPAAAEPRKMGVREFGHLASTPSEARLREMHGKTPSSLAKVQQAAGHAPRTPQQARSAEEYRQAVVRQKAQHGLAQQQQDYMARAGYKVDPKDWQQDWVPQHEDRITPDFGPVSHDVKDINSSGRPLGQAEGTAKDPIDVKGNIQEALRQLAAGKHVRLNRPTELTLLMQAIQKHAAETEAAGKDEKPDWDFGRLSVKGTNLFTAQTKGIRRINMPQFSGLAEPGTHAAQVAGGAGKFADLTDEFEQHLKDMGVKVEHTTVPAGHLKATQSELVGAKVAGFANAFLHNNPKAVAAMKEPIMVTKDGYVIDGHHRWGANMLVDAVDGRLNSDTPMNVRKVDMDIGAMIPHANAWARQVGIASAAASAGDTGAALKSGASKATPGKA